MIISIKKLACCMYLTYVGLLPIHLCPPPTCLRNIMQAWEEVLAGGEARKLEKSELLQSV